MKGDPSILLDVENLHIHFSAQEGVAKVVNGVHFRMEAGEVRALVGESGSGKSVTGLSLLGLIPRPNGRLVRGRIEFKGQDLASLTGSAFRNIRGRQISMIFQNPLSSLDPSFTIANQLTETIRYRQNTGRKAAIREAERMLEIVGIPDRKRVLAAYPFSLSGGMRQRVVIAMALSCRPDLLVADEPTTALDATIQKQILRLLKDVNEELGTAILMITHDFGVVSSLCDTVSVMYTGAVVEEGTTRELLHSPQHPYTQGLIGSLPDRRNWVSVDGRKRLQQIGGMPPDPLCLPEGCPFAARCVEATEECRQVMPDVRRLGGSQHVRCVHRKGVTTHD